MKRPDPNSPPYLSWCLAVRNSASKKMVKGHTFEKTLQLLRERTPDAEIVIVDTCSHDETPEIAKRYADVFEVYRGPEGNWDEEMLAVNSMVPARERSFELASGRWRAWIDDDDALLNREETERLLRANARVAPDEGEVIGSAEEMLSLEDALRKIEELAPQSEWIWCPYLYRRDENDHALVWQERERFIKWSDPPPFKWIEASHECMVPAKAGTNPPRVDLAHLLFVHQADFTSTEQTEYAMRRHYEVLLDQPRTTRRCIYLAAYASRLAPEKEEAFVAQALELAVSPFDRYRARVLAGNFSRKRGLFFEAVEHYGAATNVLPTMPDAWFRGAELYIERKNHALAIQWLERGLITPKGGATTEVSPWMHEIRYPTILALEYQKLAEGEIRAGLHETAEEHLKKATALLRQVCDNEAVAGDEAEASVRFHRVRNQWLGHKRMREIHELWTYLRKNDETQRAAELEKVIPHTCEDHPLAVAMEVWTRTVRTHERDPAKLYNTDAFGPVPTPAENYQKPDYLTAKRVDEMSRWIMSARRDRPIVVLDFGCFDGTVAVPLMAACLDQVVTYVAVDADERALERLQRAMAARGMAHKLETCRSLEQAAKNGVVADLIIATEVIEHVPDTEVMLRDLRAVSAPDAALFISTPWGAFDHGHPPKMTLCETERTDLGHLRAMTPWDVAKTFERSGWKVIDLSRVGSENFRQNIHAWGVRRSERFPDTVNFAVRGALWDWNGRSLHQKGMGYSESAIVFLAEHLAAQGRKAAVYGPVPEETVYAGVPYWRREKLRRIEEGSKVVVSRAPSYCREIDAMTAPIKVPKILWLQDTHYPEFDRDPDLLNEYGCIVAVSRWHADLLAESHEIPREKLHVIPNWLPPGLYERDPADWPERLPNYFIYASSPDRGLIHLLELWPRIRAMIPDARLDIFYGWEGCIALGGGASDAWLHRFEKTRRDYDRLRWQEGVREVGMRPQAVIAEALYRSAAWVYPTNFHETYGTIALQARAAGAPPVCTALAGLNESAACPQATLVDPYADDWEDRFLDGIERAVAMSKEERVEMAREAVQSGSLDAVMPLWEEILK